MSGGRIPRQTPARIFLAPGLLALATAGGLVAGLLGDGSWDLLATFCLLLPLAWLGRAIRSAKTVGGLLPAPNRAAKSAPHPRGSSPPNAERA